MLRDAETGGTVAARCSLNKNGEIPAVVLGTGSVYNSTGIALEETTILNLVVSQGTDAVIPFASPYICLIAFMQIPPRR